MSFENGRVSFRIYSLSRDLPEDYVERFARHSAPPLETSKAGKASGWVTGRHLLDRDIREETAHHAGFLRLALLEVDRKIPPSLLKTECRMEELAVIRAEGKQFLSRKEKSEIKKSVQERLLPEMPPRLKGIPFVCRTEGHSLYASALSINDSDLFCTRFVNSMGFNAIPCAPDRLLEIHGHSHPEKWKPIPFSSSVGNEANEVCPGREFLTWLLFLFDARGGLIDLDGIGRVGILVEGPLTFYREGSGVHETALKAGEPIRSPETTTCLKNGKLLKKVKLTVAQEDEHWQFSIDGDEFVFRNVKLPDIEQDLDAMSQFEERIDKLDRLRDIFFGLYNFFAVRRCNPDKWQREIHEIREWVQSRPK